MILLDSSILIEPFRTQIKSKTAFHRISKDYSEYYISSVTFYEIGIGNNAQHQAYWEALSSQLNILPFDEKCAIEAIRIYQDLKNQNKLIDLADILIAATAISHKLPLATLNKKHFNRIQPLKVM